MLAIFAEVQPILCKVKKKYPFKQGCFKQGCLKCDIAKVLVYDYKSKEYLESASHKIPCFINKNASKSLSFV